MPTEVEDEEPEVVDSPRVRKRPDHVKDFICRNMNMLSPIYEEPEVEENLSELECMLSKSFVPPDDPESTVVWLCCVLKCEKYWGISLRPSPGINRDEARNG